VGWALDIQSLKRVVPGVATMKFNTACCLVLLGAALVVGAQSRISRVASWFVSGVVIATLMEYALGRSFGIDEALFRDTDGGAVSPGRMAVATAVCLGMAVFAVIALRRGHARAVTSTAILMMSIGWLGCLGYAFGVRALYDSGQLSTVAPHTAAAIVILAVGLMSSTDRGALWWIAADRDPGATVMRQILPLALLGLPAFAAVRLAGERAGWYSARFGLTLTVVVVSTAFAAVARHSALVVTRLHRAVLAANAELFEANATLEHRVEQRTGELALSESRARALAGSAPVGIFHTDLRGHCTYVNERWCEIHGVTADEALSDRGGFLVHPDDREAVLGRWTNATADGTPFESEYRLLRPTGEIAWVHRRSAPVVDDHGNPSGFVGTITDITSSRAAEQSLRETEGLFRTMFGSSPVAMALINSDRFIVRANAALTDLTGLTPDVLLTMQLDSIARPEVLGNGEHRSGNGGVEQRIARPDGSARWTTIRYAQIDEPDTGAPTRTIVQFIDTTDRRQHEDDLFELANRDSLSGLLNRRSFEVALSNHLIHCKRYGETGAVLMLDLDHFKRINDSFGHNVGDQVIVQTAELLRRRVRESDVIARLGGDEFVVLLTTGNRRDSCAVAQNLVDEFERSGIVVDGKRVALSASIGVAVVEHIDNVERARQELLVDADLAMYNAKKLGRNRWDESRHSVSAISQ
jgi:diguanylate cyclase (GGDEF)-like protein/PAS domain S-box-containing protein